MTTEEGAPGLTPRERRLRRALIGVSMLAALALLAMAGIVFYWYVYQFTRETEGAEVSLTDFGHLRVDGRGGRVDFAFIDSTGRVRDRTSSG